MFYERKYFLNIKFNVNNSSDIVFREILFTLKFKARCGKSGIMEATKADTSMKGNVMFELIRALIALFGKCPRLQFYWKYFIYFTWVRFISCDSSSTGMFPLFKTYC